MKFLTCLALVVVLSFTGVSLVVAQQSAQPVVRLGNWIEVGNEVFMDIIGTMDINYRTTQNYDFESRVRDRTASRSVESTLVQGGSFDGHWAEVRFGANFRYQKNLTAQVLFEQQNIFDAAVIDGRQSGQNSPGGRDIFDRAAVSEDNKLHVERYWLRYKFAGTPLTIEAGASIWYVDQARMVNDDDPRFAVFADFGDLDLMAAAVIERAGQRLGLTNDNNKIYYTFSGGYNFKPHRVQLDVIYSRDRFDGADTLNGGADDGLRGQKIDGVNINASWTGKVGPVGGLVQGMVSTGSARGGTGFNLPAGAIPSRDYSILGFGVVARAEVDLGVIKPWAGVLYATGDDDPSDDKLEGFHQLGFTSSGAGTTNAIFTALDTSPAAGNRRAYFCPGGGPSSASVRPGGGNLAIGRDVFASFFECDHSIGNHWNNNIGNLSHPGISVVYSNPGGLILPVGIDVYPLKGHIIRTYYLYKQFDTTRLLEIAFNLPRGSIDKGEVHEIGGQWLWTLNPHLDFQLSGSAGFAAAGYKDLARLADCNPTASGVQSCAGDDVALAANARFRARF